MGAYVDDKPFSVELVGAVLRQANFVKKMHELGWTGRGFFDKPEDQAVLRHCIARYMGYVAVLESSSVACLIKQLLPVSWT